MSFKSHFKNTVFSFCFQAQLLRPRSDRALGRRHMSDSVGLHHVRRFYVHDFGKRWPGQRAIDPGRSAAAPPATASDPATAATATAAQPTAAAPAAAAPATATDASAVPTGPKRQAQGADGREAVEDHRRPEHIVPRQLDQAGRRGDPQVPGLVDQEVRGSQSDRPKTSVEFRVVVPVLVDVDHNYR